MPQRTTDAPRPMLRSPQAFSPRLCGLLLTLLFACRPTESMPLASSSGPSAASASSAPAPAQAGGGHGGVAECPEGPVVAPFADGAWSVRSLLCARGTLRVGQRFVLRAVPTGGSDCACPPNVACAPCMPTVVFRDTAQDEQSVTLRARSPTGLVNGKRADVPVRVLEWGAPPAPIAQLVWTP